MAPLLRTLALVLVLAVPQVAQAYVYLTRDQLVATWFADADRVETAIFEPSAAQRAALKQVLGYAPPKPRYEILVGRRGDAVTGYAVVDDQLGQHEPITFGVWLDPAAKVRGVEILVYREAYGEGVRAPAFRGQFVGLDARAPMKVGKDVRIVSGATISSRSLAVGTRRACALVEAWLAAQPAVAG